MIQEADLAQFIEKNAVDCFNTAVGHGAQEMISGRSFIESDIGNEILLTIPFNEHVKLNSIILRAVPSKAKEELPTIARLFVDKPDLQLRDAKTMKPTQEIQLQQEALASGAHIPLKYVLFQNVSSLTIYLRSSNGVEKVFLGGIQLFGAPRNGTNMKNWSQVVKEQKEHE